LLTTAFPLIYGRRIIVITLYGIKNCDTVKKACKWLDEQTIAYQFHDLRTDGLTSEMITPWINAAGWETVLNKRGTTWRKLAPGIQQQVTEKNVTELLLEHPAMIKRPVLDIDGTITIGFKADKYTMIFDL
jgi:arsenate reductase